ncbi:DUF29 domain-containing protein [uncultured Enterovirga sp.]|uniref:DUF29 domain-containing protein n=1 Tax=uncultured Enterovirga sp. TaxID=2026352 RepID=UPI0035CAC18F
MAGLATVEEVADGDSPAGVGSLYEQDFARWAFREAEILQAGRLDELDLANLVEEIESLGREQFDKIRSHFRIILLHMLNWDQQPERRTRSWTLSIRDARDQVDTTVESSPSLKRRRQEAVASAYRGARLRAALETDLPLSTFPEKCPYGFDEILNRPFLWSDD